MVFPNPTTDSFVLQLPAHAQVRGLTVSDASGRVLQVKDLITEDGRIVFDLSNNEIGLYLVQVEFADGTRTLERVVKQ